MWKHQNFFLFVRVNTLKEKGPSFLFIFIQDTGVIPQGLNIWFCLSFITQTCCRTSIDFHFLRNSSEMEKKIKTDDNLRSRFDTLETSELTKTTISLICSNAQCCNVYEQSEFQWIKVVLTLHAIFWDGSLMLTSFLYFLVWNVS